ALDRLESEHDNLRAGLDRLDAAGEGQLQQRLAAALWPFWQRRGHYDEARRRLERALEADERPTEARAWTVYGAAVIHADSGNSVAAKQLFDEALALETFGDALSAARIRMNLGAIALNEGDFERGREILEDAVRAFDQLGDEHWVVAGMTTLAGAHYEVGNLTRGRGPHEEGVQ